LLAAAREWSPDAIITDSVESATLLADELGPAGPAILFEIANPLGASIADGSELVSILAIDPGDGEVQLAEYERHCADAIQWVNTSACHGVYYRLSGASEEFATPMQYGGHFLEIDRRLLSQLVDHMLVMAHIEGGDGLYLDSVSDLAVDFLAWDDARWNTSAAVVRGMRQGAVALGLTNEPERTWIEYAGSGIAIGGRVSSFEDPAVENASRVCPRLRSFAAHE
jgi:hypothetical protein